MFFTDQKKNFNNKEEEEEGEGEEEETSVYYRLSGNEIYYNDDKQVNSMVHEFPP